MGLWSKNPATAEGKYPIVLRRDGSPVEHPYFVILARDPNALAALIAYAGAAEKNGFPSEYVEDIKQLAQDFEEYRRAAGDGDPSAPRHRKDDPVTLAWARSLHTKSA